MKYLNTMAQNYLINLQIYGLINKSNMHIL